MAAPDRRLRAAAAAVLWAIAGLLVTALATPLLGAPFFMFQFAAVVGAALQGGFGAGLLAMALSGLGFFALYFAPSLEPFETFRLAAFLLVSTGFAWLAARMRRALAAAVAARPGPRPPRRRPGPSAPSRRSWWPSSATISAARSAPSR